MKKKSSKKKAAKSKKRSKPKAKKRALRADVNSARINIKLLPKDKREIEKRAKKTHGGSLSAYLREAGCLYVAKKAKKK